MHPDIIFVEKGVNNFDRMAASVKSIKDSINGMELDKLAKFNDLIFNINASMETDALEELVDTFAEFIEELADQLGTIANNTSSEVEVTPNTIEKNSDLPSRSKKNSDNVTSEEASSITLDTSSIEDRLDSIATILRTSTLKVRSSDEF